jgi:hypothetical protein
MENLDKVITNFVKNWHDDPCMNCMPNKNMKDYLKARGYLVHENYELIEKAEIFEILNVDGD